MALTAGDFLVYDGAQWQNQPSTAGSLSIDSPTFYVDSVHHRVGIGLTAPHQILDVDAAGANLRIRGNTSSGTAGYLTQANTAAYLANNAYFDGSGSDFTPESTGVGAASLQLDRGFIALRVAAPTLTSPITWTEAMRVDSSARIGVGTTSPSERLHLANGGWFVDNFSSLSVNAELFGAWKMTGAGGWARGMGWIGPDGATKAIVGGFGTGSTFTYLYLGPTYTSPWLVALPSGNIGIGTTSPTSLFHVLGAQPASVSGNGTNATQVVQVTGGKGGNTTGTTGQTGGTGAPLNLTGGAGGDAPSGSNNGPGGAVTINGGGPGTGAGAAGSTGVVVLQSVGGNVGIGTTAPQQALALGPGNNIAVEMAVPATPMVSLLAGGSLTVGTTYYYKITALDGSGGETVASAEASITPTTGNQTVSVSCAAITGALTYRFYRGTSAGGENHYFTNTGPSFTDTGGTGTPGSPPSSTTAYINKITASGNSWLLGGSLGLGITPPTAVFHVVGSQPASVSGNGTAATQVLTMGGGKGGNTTGTTGQTGGTGAAVSIGGGDGGDAPSGSTNGTGGSITLNGGAPGGGAGAGGNRGQVVLQAQGGTVVVGIAGATSQLLVQNTYELDGDPTTKGKLKSPGYQYGAASVESQGTNRSATLEIVGDNSLHPTLAFTHAAVAVAYMSYNGSNGIVSLDQDFALTTAGKGLRVKEGTNAKMGVQTLAAGTTTVNTTAVTANSRIFLTPQNTGTAQGSVYVSARTAGTSFTITSTSGTDDRQVAWLIIEPS